MDDNNNCFDATLLLSRENKNFNPDSGEGIVNLPEIVYFNNYFYNNYCTVLHVVADNLSVSEEVVVEIVNICGNFVKNQIINSWYYPSLITVPYTADSFDYTPSNPSENLVTVPKLETIHLKFLDQKGKVIKSLTDKTTFYIKLRFSRKKLL